MITIKTKEQIESLREGGKIHGEILEKVAEMVRPGVTGLELNDYADKLVRDSGNISSFLNYRPEGISSKYPASLCVSIDSEIVHGIPDDEPLVEGQIVSLDLGVKHDGVFTDAAVTVAVGEVHKELNDLILHTKEALEVAIAQCVAGNHVGDIGHAVENFNNGKYGIVRNFAGHGVGIAVHEDPNIPNWGQAGSGAELVSGMVLALEPMFNLGKDAVIVGEDEYTVMTADGLPAAHFEHTVLITENGPEVLTR